MAYFRYFNKIGYDVRGVKNNLQIDNVTNILQRARLKLDHLDHNLAFVQHFILDGQTPEYLAHEFYGDSELHWIILFGQKCVNPYYDWPMTYFTLQKYISKKYGAASINEVHHYEDADRYTVDSTASGAVPITNALYEETINDEKRLLNVIRPESVSAIISEFKALMK